MLLSAPASAALDALFASLASVLGGEPFQTPATPGFKNVLDDLTLLDDAEPAGNARQQSAASGPSSKKELAPDADAPGDMSWAPSTIPASTLQARLTPPATGTNLLPAEKAPSDAGSSQPSAGDSTAALPLENPTATVATAAPAVTAQPENHAAIPATRLAVASGARSSVTLVANREFAGHAGINTSSRTASEPAVVRPASQPLAVPADAAPTGNNMQTATNKPALTRNPAAAFEQDPPNLPVSNPTPAAVPAQEPGSGNSSITRIDQQRSGASLTARVPKNSLPGAHESTTPPGSPSPVHASAANSSARHTLPPGAIATLPPPANHERLSANVSPIVTPVIDTPVINAGPPVSSAPAIAPSQQQAQPNKLKSAPEARTPEPARASAFPAPSTHPEFLTIPLPAPPASEQAPQAQTATPATASSPAAGNLAQAAQPQTTSGPAPSVTPVPAAVPGHLAPSQPTANEATQPASPLTSQIETPGVSPDAKSPLLPRAENLAFALRLLGLDAGSSRAPLTQSGASPSDGEPPLTQSNAQSLTQPRQPVVPPQNSPAQQTVTSEGQDASQPNVNQQNSNQAAHETQAGGPTPAKPFAQNQPEIPAAPKSAQPPHPADNPAFQAAGQNPQFESPALGLDRGEGAQPHALLAAQEARLGGLDLPRSSASSEILLHLTGGDQAQAAIRVADRAGAVNVSVHTADPVLRESLRTNLSDLSAQLNLQGWKTDSTKSAAVATHSDNPQDSHSGGQRGSGQQGSGGDRQPQRERRGNGGQWHEALNQQIASNETHPGGNR